MRSLTPFLASRGGMENAYSISINAINRIFILDPDGSKIFYAWNLYACKAKMSSYI